MKLGRRGVEVARSLLRIPGRGHWGRGRPTRAMGEELGRGGAKGDWEGSVWLTGYQPLP